MCDNEVFDIVALPFCPHCATANEAFDLVKEISSNGIKSLFLHCRNCGKCVVAEMKDDICLQTVFENFTNIYPDNIPSDIPKFLPNNIEGRFIQAKQFLRSKHFEASSIMARKCLEITCYNFKAQGNSLLLKIDNLHKRDLLTNTLTEWAHAVRLIGNMGAHDEEAISQQDTQDIVYFTEMFLTYIYTLPEMVKQRLPDSLIQRIIS